jgi:hypothetical protein
MSSPCAGREGRLTGVRLARVLSHAVVAIALGFATEARGDDFQTWYSISLRWLETEHVALVTSGHFRLTDGSTDFSLYRFGQGAAGNPLSWLRAAATYRYGERDARGEFRSQQRGEFQLTPHWPIGRHMTMSFRNRLELRWGDGVDGMNERTRHRIRLTVPTPQWNAVRAVYFSNEVFYDFDRDDLSENRLVPLGVRIPLHDRAGLRFGYMLRSARSGGAWATGHILYTGLSLRI